MKAAPQLLLVLGLVLILACGGGGSTTSSSGSSTNTGAASNNTWVGRVADSDAFIAIMKQGTAHLIHLTDGKQLSVWFKGDASGAVVGYFTFYNDDGGSIINNPQGDGFSGTVTVGRGQHYRYSVTPARGEAGLYRAKETIGGEMWESGWVVLNDGQVRGARRSQSGTVEGLATRGGVQWTDPKAEP